MPSNHHRKDAGELHLDLSEVTYRELHCHSLQDKSVVIAGNARAITPAILSDEAVLHVDERQLIFNPITSGNSRILKRAATPLESTIESIPNEMVS